jgi:hypothetical protein
MVISGTFLKVLVVNNLPIKLFSLDSGGFIILILRGFDHLDERMTDYNFISRTKNNNPGVPPASSTPPPAPPQMKHTFGEGGKERQSRNENEGKSVPRRR